MVDFNQLKLDLEVNLPGHTAHAKVMQHRKPIDQLGAVPNSAKLSAVLLLLYPKQNELHTTFIRRQVYKGVHSGQISLPGGKKEKQDASLLSTALREANEEVGIIQNDLEIIGNLTPLYVPPSNFIIHPYVAFQKATPTFIGDEYEVAEILEVPLKQLLNPESFTKQKVKVPGQILETKGFNLNGKVLWGATAMIVKEFIEVVELQIKI